MAVDHLSWLPCLYLQLGQAHIGLLSLGGRFLEAPPAEDLLLMSVQKLGNDPHDLVASENVTDALYELEENELRSL